MEIDTANSARFKRDWIRTAPAIEYPDAELFRLAGKIADNAGTGEDNDGRRHDRK
jgi:hypothetical protein